MKINFDENFFSDEQRQKIIRKFLIDNVEYKNKDFPYNKAFYAVINTTNFCPVGCPHCLYSSKKFKDKDQSLGKKTINNFIKIVNQANLKMLVISGGGEPFENLEIMLEAIRSIETLEDVIIITSAYFSKDKETTEMIMNKICRAGKEERIKNKLKEVIITIRISRDNSQCKVIPTANIINLINYIIKKSEKNKIRVLLRTILDKNNDNDLEISQKLNFKLKPHKNIKNIHKGIPIIDSFPTRWMVNNDNTIQIPVIYKPLYVLGRAFSTKMKDTYSLWKIVDSEIESGTSFNLCLRGPKGEGHNFYETVLRGYDFWNNNLNMHYNTPKNEFSKGLALYMQATSHILINNGVPDISPDIRGIKNWQHLLDIFYSDPLQMLLIEKGPYFIKKIVEEIEKEIDKEIEETNFVFSISLFCLNNPAIRLYLTIMAIKYYYKNNQINVKSEEIKQLIKINKQDFINAYTKWKESLEYKMIKHRKYIDPITGDADNII